MSDWQDISTYPRCKKCNDPNCDWGPEVVVLCPPTKTHIVLNEAPQPEFETDILIYVAHLEAGEWLTRCAEGPIAWAALHTKPTHWAPLPSHDERRMNWQPIESAPRDGTRILVCSSARLNSVGVAHWEPNSHVRKPLPFWRMEGIYGDNASRAHQPAHWMPLPEPPEAE